MYIYIFLPLYILSLYKGKRLYYEVHINLNFHIFLVSILLLTSENLISRKLFQIFILTSIILHGHYSGYLPGVCICVFINYDYVHLKISF